MRPIDADELTTTFIPALEMGYKMPINTIMDAIQKAPTLDVQPVIHAHWEPFEKEAYWFQDIEEIWETGKPTKQIQYKCSHCLAEFGIIVVEQNYMYCPKCSAKMDEDVEEDNNDK